MFNLLKKTRNYLSKAKKNMTQMSPTTTLESISRDTKLDLNDPQFAIHLDSLDPLAFLRSQFCIPTVASLQTKTRKIIIVMLFLLKTI
jgi:hypothetical protein